MIQLDTTNLQKLGRSMHTTYFVIEENILGAMPDPGTHDDAASARSNIDFLHRHFRTHGPGAVLVFSDMYVSQDRAGRMIYQTQIDPALVLGAGIVGGTMLARAIGTVFLGLGRSRVPFQLFSAVPPALDWARARKFEYEDSTR